MTLEELKKELNNLKDEKQAENLQRFFKTGKGEYGEGDIFFGVKVPIQRKICKKFNLGLKDIQKLLDSEIHEYRLCALFILVDKYKKADIEEKKEIFEFYLRNTKNINNWDLIDLSAPNIIGDFLYSSGKNYSEIIKFLGDLANSLSLWERRISVLSSFYFIRQNSFLYSIKLSEILLGDKQDLIHKAVGWMLREIGKRDENLLYYFLDKHSKKMPRTMLRYSIEKLDKNKKEKYMTK